MSKRSNGFGCYIGGKMMKKLLKIALLPLALLTTLTLGSCDSKQPEKPTGPYEPPAPETLEITGIRITSNPNRMIYQPGEKINLQGLLVAVDYVNGESDIIGPASINHSNTALVAGQTTYEISFREVHKTYIEGLTVKKSALVKFEVESEYAYISKPNNHDASNQFKIASEPGNDASGGKYLGNLGRESFGVTFTFIASDVDECKIHLSSDFQTRYVDTDNSWQEPLELPMSQVYELHVNGKKVNLGSLKLYDREWLSFDSVELGSAQLNAGYNSVSLFHLMRNGENGNLDYIGIETGADITLVKPTKTLIEAEDMTTSGTDIGFEGNNASNSTGNTAGDCVKNRASGQSGWSETLYNSSKEQTVSLLINFGLNLEFNMKEWDIIVNETKIQNVDTTIPYHFWSGIAWKDWNEIYICDIPLKEGQNKIRISKPNKDTNGTNMDYIVLLAA